MSSPLQSPIQVSSSSSDSVEEFKNNENQSSESSNNDAQVQLKFEIGEQIDCQDTVKKWLNAEIVAIRNDNEIKVHYSGWGNKFDEWLPFESPRILKQWQTGKQIQLNNRLDVRQTEVNRWLEARVQEIDLQNSNRVQIKYVGYHKKYEEWVDVTDLERVAEIGMYSQAYGKTSLVTKNQTQKSQKYKQFLESIVRRESNFKNELQQKNMLIKVMEGDGNCLFRAVSDQMYGTQNFHKEIRHITMDYIELEKEFFQNYIIGNSQGFQYYIYKKRQDGEWGDDIELQALSEIYNRSIEIFAYSLKPMRTFHESHLSQNESIRLSYHGQSHYNSVKFYGRENAGILFPNPIFGQIESQSLSSAQQRSEIRKQQSLLQQNTASNVIIQDLINKSRKEFEQIGKRDMEQALEESLKNYENQNEMNIKEAIHQSIELQIDQEEEKTMVDQAIQESRNYQEQLEQQELEKALAESIDPFQDDVISKVVAMGLNRDDVIYAYQEFPTTDPIALYEFCISFNMY